MVPSPSTANTGAFGSSIRAASANDNALPIEPVDAVDQAAADRKHALAPLREFAAVADQHGVGIALDEGTQRPEHFGRMQAARRLRNDVAPRRRPVVERGASFVCQPTFVGRRLRASDQRRAGARDVGDAADQQPFALFRPGALDHGVVRIDRDHAHIRIERRARRPFGGEVERLAEQHDQVGAPDEVGEGAERGVGDAARALHDDGRGAGRGFELSEQGAAG